MNIGIVLNSNELETVWNAFRFGVEALDKGHKVKLFLLGKGVECEGLQSEKFNTQRTIGAFKKRGGILLACGTCLKIRDKEESGICSVSTMDDMLNLVVESDKVMTFG
ncbi:MAG TPA: DsrE family protein [Candidatus Aenigmarchaeota archaeon]|nr:DsrE family protein [Candidatus Aenigmarchaeota archaeon]